MGSVVVTSTSTLVADPAAVWPLATATDRANRLVIGKSTAFKPIEAGADTSARFVVETKAAGFSLSYEESPFEWTENKSFSVYRRMRSGPIVGYTFGMELEPTAEGGTRVTVRLDLQPRHWLLAPIARLEGNRIVRGFRKLLDEIDAHLSTAAPSPYVEPKSPAEEQRLTHAEVDLRSRGLPETVVAAIIGLLRSSPDADLVRMRPLEIAHDLKLDGLDMLRGFLHAVTTGLVELRWALVCPSCRTANEQVKSLADIGTESHCQLCDLAYGIDLDRSVEATFVPHPSVRQVPDQMFCIGGPSRTPHVVVQAVVERGAVRSIAVPAEAGRYRLFARGGAIASIDVAVGEPSEAKARLVEGQWQPAEIRIAPGGALVVENVGGPPLHVKIERLGYASFAATAQIVMTMSEFRRFFSRDLLKPSTPLKVSHCAILFSDLTGSTALYTAAGDAAAFRLVDDHFDVLRKAIGQHAGVVVKTMGDAIMASFIDAESCVRAAVTCLRDFEAFRAKAENGSLTGLKLGLFSGPCYVVTANDSIDYFGQTVNCAARVQHCAESGEIVFEESVYQQLFDNDRTALQVVERFQTHVKGVAHALKLVRVKLA